MLIVSPRLENKFTTSSFVWLVDEGLLFTEVRDFVKDSVNDLTIGEGLFILFVKEFLNKKIFSSFIKNKDINYISWFVMILCY